MLILRMLCFRSVVPILLISTLIPLPLNPHHIRQHFHLKHVGIEAYISSIFQEFTPVYSTTIYSTLITCQAVSRVLRLKSGYNRTWLRAPFTLAEDKNNRQLTLTEK